MTDVEITYSGFYDFPLAFLASYGGKQYLFWRVFDDELDDYPREYEVFVLPNLSNEEINASWSFLPERAETYIGKIDVKRITFDPTKRHSIKSNIFEDLLN